MRLTPVTALVAWMLLLGLVAGLARPFGAAPDRRGVVLWDGLMVANAVILCSLVAWDVRRRRNAREAATAPPGRCPSCGRDLRPSERRCPECGTVVTIAASPERGRDAAP